MGAVTYHYLRNKCNLYKGIHPIDWYTFINQMDYLKKSKSTLFMNENLESYIGNYKDNWDEKKFIVTFDDGLKEHFKAAEILARKGIKSIFSIIGCTVLEGKIPLVHKLHWLRSKLEPNYLKNELESILKKPLITNKNIIEKARNMHIHDDIDTAVIKYNLNFVIDYYELDLATSKIIKKFIDSENSFCNKYFLSIEEIYKISKLGHIIAWHTNYHIPMSKLSNKELEIDLELGIKFLDKINTNENKHICYPYGRLDALPLQNLELILSSKFKYGWTLDKVNNQFINKKYNKLLLQRITSNELFKKNSKLCL